METHCSILAWKSPRTEEPGWLQSMGRHRAGHNCTTNFTTARELTPQATTETWHNQINSEHKIKWPAEPSRHISEENSTDDQQARGKTLDVTDCQRKATLNCSEGLLHTRQDSAPCRSRESLQAINAGEAEARGPPPLPVAM